MLATQTDVEPAAPPPPPRLDRPWEVVVTEAEGELLLQLLRSPNKRCSVVVDRANLPEATASLVDKGLIRVKRWSKSRKASIMLGDDAVYVFSGIFKARRG